MEFIFKSKLGILESSAGFWLPGYGSGSKGQNIDQKLQKNKILLLKPKSELLKKERL